MTQSIIITVLQDAITVTLECAMPMMAVALVIGVLVSIFQAATQISEQTLAFVPKIIGVFLVLLVCAGLILSKTSDLVMRMYAYMNQISY